MVEPDDHLAETIEVIASDSLRMDCLASARELGLPQWYLAAGFVRNAIWDRQHSKRTSLNDIDLVFFSPSCIGAEAESDCESQLSKLAPVVPWQVRNQARMHRRNRHDPYEGTEDAIAHWPEIPTCVGIRLESDDTFRIVAPFGLRESWSLTVRPNPEIDYPQEVMLERVESKRWLHTWPLLRVMQGPGA